MMMNRKIKILILAGGGIKHMENFVKASESLNVDVLVASSSHLEYITNASPFLLTVEGQDIKNFDLVYIRLVGKRNEDISLLVNYCRDNNILVFDKMFERTDLIRVPITKSVESKILSENGLPLPRTYFGSLKNIKQKAPQLFGFPFVIKGTTGKQGNAVWSPKDSQELDEIYLKLLPRDLKGERFIAQEFIEASQRIRAFVIGEKVIEAITRPTRWRKRFLGKINGQFPEGVRERVENLSLADKEIALDAAKVLGINVGGVDLIKEDKTGRTYILEVNSAPRWEAVKKDTGLDVELEILKWLITQVPHSSLNIRV